MFIFHFHNIFVVTYYVNISVIDTLIHVGRIKMLHKHTHLALYVLTACGHWTIRLNCLIYRPRSTFIYCSDPNMVTKFLSSLVKVMASHQFGASHCLNQLWYIVNWDLRNKRMLNYIVWINSLCRWNLLENVICKTVAIFFRPWCFNS